MMDVKKIVTWVGGGCLAMGAVSFIGFALGQSAVVGIWAAGRHLRTMDAVADDVSGAGQKTTRVKMRPKTFDVQSDRAVDGTEDAPVVYTTWNKGERFFEDEEDRADRKGTEDKWK